LTYLQLTSIVIKSLGLESSTSTTLGVGLSSTQYLGYLRVIVYDIYSTSGTTTTTVTVNPMDSMNTLLQLSNSLISTLSLILSAKDPNMVTSTIGNYATTINTMNINCTLKLNLNCTSLNRGPCSTISKTCGNCLPGYLHGSSMDPGNTLCLSDSKSLSTLLSLKVNGDFCTSNTQCLEGLCENQVFLPKPGFNQSTNSFVCKTAMKSCDSETCSNRGVCSYKDYFNNSVSTCATFNDSCFSECQCNSGYFGLYCRCHSKCLPTVNHFSETSNHG
jgi:hypothetical protein